MLKINEPCSLPAWEATFTYAETDLPVTDLTRANDALAKILPYSNLDTFDVESGVYLIGLPPLVEAFLWNTMTDGSGFDLTLGTPTLPGIRIRIESSRS